MRSLYRHRHAALELVGAPARSDIAQLALIALALSACSASDPAGATHRCSSDAPCDPSTGARRDGGFGGDASAAGAGGSGAKPGAGGGQAGTGNGSSGGSGGASNTPGSGGASAGTGGSGPDD